jgi:hypothetical protein
MSRCWLVLRSKQFIRHLESIEIARVIVFWFLSQWSNFRSAAFDLPKLRCFGEGNQNSLEHSDFAWWHCHSLHKMQVLQFSVFYV